MSSNLEIAKQHLAALEQGVDCNKLAEFFSLEFRAGKIVAQRNYDCFEPW
jgi:hypothetical protein